MVSADVLSMLSGSEADVQAIAPARVPAKSGVVLLVDDSMDVHQLVADDLAESYLVVAVASAQAGLQRLSNGLRPEVVIVDLLMPEMDGIEFIDAMRADPKLAYLPVIIVSAVSVPPQFQRRDAVYLTKPYRQFQLLDAVRSSTAKP